MNVPASALPKDVAPAQGAHNDQSTFIAALLSRESCWPLVEPGPREAELDLIFDAALRAPDHGRLRPWRFVCIRGTARAELGKVLVELVAAREPDKPRSVHEHRRQRAHAAPVIVALGAAISTDTAIPEIKQLLSAGAAAMNMLNAIHALGYGGFWVTGVDTYDPLLHRALDFEPSDRLLGFLFIGSRQSHELTAERPSRAEHVREWLGCTSI